MSTITARSPISSLALLAALVPLSVAFPTEAAKAPAKGDLTPQALASPEGREVDTGPQFLQADRKGRLFLVRAGALDVVPLLPDGRPGKAAPLKASAEGGKEARLRGAMSGGGDWIIRTGAKCRLFRAGKEEPVLDPEWLVWSVGWVGDDPVLGVDPVRTVPGPAPKGAPPLILRWNGRAWETLVSEPLAADAGEPYDVALRQTRAVELFGDSRGTLWAANRNRYVLRHYSAAGRLRLTLTVGKGGVEQRKDAAAVQKAFAKQAAGNSTGRMTAQAATALPVTDAMAEGRDGNLYILVHHAWAGGDFVLDRYDPVRSVLERAPLRLKDVGVMSMAGGRDGLYLAAFSSQRGRWRVAWEDIDDATWAPVKGVKTDAIEQATGEPPN